MLLSKPESCRPCAQWNDGQGWSEVEGCGSSGLLIVGESSGYNERNDGLPFRPFAEAGSVLQKAFQLAGRPRSEHMLTNALRCQPGRMEGPKFVGVNEMGPSADAAIACCRPHLDAVVTAARPKCILALGNMPLRALTSYDGEVEHKQSVTNVRGFQLWSERYDLPVVATYHPSFLRHGAMHLFGALLRDLRLALAIAKRGPKPKPPTAYQLYPSVEEARRFAASVTPDSILAYDIETRDSDQADEDDAEWGGTDITQIQFSLAAGSGIVLPWVEPFREIACEVLAKPCHKLDFNGWEYDLKVLAAKGVHVEGQTEDLRWCWHHLQPDLPGKSHKGGLQYVTSFACPEFEPWKHTFGQDLATYGAADVDVLHHIRTWLYAQLSEQGMLPTYECQVLRLRRTLRDAEVRGICIDRVAQADVRAVIEREMSEAFAVMQAACPDELKPCLPKEGYKNEKIAIKAQAKPLAEGEKWTRRAFVVMEPGPASSGCTGADDGSARAIVSVPSSVERWVRLQPFKPSSQQLMAYMRHRKHRVPKIAGLDKETANKLGMQRLFAKTRDSLYGAALSYKGAQKMASSYLWECGPDGRVHTTYTFRPATGQLAAINPPVMTIPKQTALADSIRRTICASPGHTLVSFDYQAFHVLTMGFEAGDPDFMRLARLDIHSFMAASHFLKIADPGKLLGMSDADLLARLGAFKADTTRTWDVGGTPRTFKWVRNFQAKKALLGYDLGLQAKHLYEANVEYFGSQREAQAALDAIDAAFPRVAAYRKRIREEAARRKYIKTRHGYVRWFWDDRGGDGEAAISLQPQNDAHGHFKEALLRVDEAGWAERYGFVLPVHDDLTFDCPNELVADCIRDVRAEMERPSEVLVNEVAPDGLACAVSVSVGPNLGEMREMTL